MNTSSFPLAALAFFLSTVVADDQCFVAQSALGLPLLQIHHEQQLSKATEAALLSKHGTRFSGTMSLKHVFAQLSHILRPNAASLLSEALIIGSGAVVAVGLLAMLLLIVRGIPEKSEMGSRQQHRSEELPWSTFVIFILVFGGMGFCTDQFIPSLPAMAVEFGVSEEVMSTSLQVNWVTSAIGTCVAGALSDRLGRRPVMLVLISILTVSTAACSCAPTFGWFIAGRILQGIGESGGAVVLATFRDYYDDPVRRAMIVGWVDMTKMIGPVIAPPVGGIFASYAGWRPLFLCLSVFNAFLLILSFISIEESVTLACDTTVWSDLVRVLSDRHRVIIIVANSFLWGYFQTFLSNISYVYETDYSLPLFSASMLIGVLAGAVILGISCTQFLLQFQGDIVKSANVGYLSLSLPISMTVIGFLVSSDVTYYTVTIFMAHLLCMTPIIAMDALFSQDLKDISGTATGIAWALMGVSATFLSVLGSVAGSKGPRLLMLTFALQLIVASIIYWLGFALSPPKWAMEDCQGLQNNADESSSSELDRTKGPNSS